ncbi:(2Fe-2S)-binding protein [Aminirod propionatiphilus]|uniref:(2Fe-2S)-binding protein n=1 Tax=Aminirod propionatiphilus TaxID=3415223 RepID=A0ACD1DUA0_9BACT|nr:(2Fe-2S)-binding protein [Synergistota bacterium]
MQELKCVVNGREVTLQVDPGRNLVDVLRRDLGLTGVKVGCEEGECGACTILLDGKPVNSCIIPVMKAQGRHILTIEGLAEEGELDPIQEAFIEAGAVQCGFCTPGVVLSAKSLLDEMENPTKEEVREALSGHLCRCTGYLQFYDALKLAVEKIAARKAARS